MIQNISLTGFDYIVPLTAATNFGMAGATLLYYIIGLAICFFVATAVVLVLGVNGKNNRKNRY